MLHLSDACNSTSTKYFNYIKYLQNYKNYKLKGVLLRDIVVKLHKFRRFSTENDTTFDWFFGKDDLEGNNKRQNIGECG